jgi:hypothetical protein
MAYPSRNFLTGQFDRRGIGDMQDLGWVKRHRTAHTLEQAGVRRFVVRAFRRLLIATIGIDTAGRTAACETKRMLQFAEMNQLQGIGHCRQPLSMARARS